MLIKRSAVVYDKVFDNENELRKVTLKSYSIKDEMRPTIWLIPETVVKIYHSNQTLVLHSQEHHSMNLSSISGMLN